MGMNRKTLLLFAPLLLVAAVVLYAWAVPGRKRQEPNAFQDALTLPRHRMKIEGFRYSGYHEGRKVLRIEADAFTVEKMRLGHFRLSLYNVAKLRNGRIDLFGEEIGPARQGGAGDPEIPADLSNIRPAAFSQPLAGESLPNFGVKRVAELTVEPVIVRLYRGDDLLTRLSASSASIDPREGGIRFKGRVRVCSGPRVLETGGALMFTPEHGTLEVQGAYELQLGTGKTLSGEGLRCDLSLRPAGTPLLSEYPEPRPRESARSMWASPHVQDRRPVPPSP